MIKIVRVSAFKGYHSWMIILPPEWVGKTKEALRKYLFNRYNAARKSEGVAEVHSLPRCIQYVERFDQIVNTKEDREYWKQCDKKFEEVLDIRSGVTTFE